MKLNKTVLFVVAILINLATSSTSMAGYLWWSILEESCDSASSTCEVRLTWNSSKADKYDKWRVCWKEKGLSNWLDDICDHHAKRRPIGEPNVWIRDLEMDDKEKYKVKLYGRKENNGNWVQAHTISSSTCVEVYQNSFNASLWGVRFC